MNENLPLYYQKVIPIDERFFLLVGGAKNPNINALLERPIEHSLILVSNENASKRIIGKRALPYPAVHAAATLYNKRQLFIVGGKFKEQWSPSVYFIDTV